MKRFFRFLLNTSSWAVLRVMPLSVAAGLFSAALIALIGRLFTNLEAGVPWLVVVAIVVLVLALTALEYFAKKVLLKHSEAIASEFRLGFARWRIAQPLAKAEAQGPTASLATYSEDIKRVTMALEYLPEVGVSLAAICGAALYLTWVSAPVMIFAILAVVPAAWVFLKIQRKVRKSLMDMLAARDGSNALFRSMLLGEKELKLDPSRAEAIYSQHLAPSSRAISQHAERLALMYTVGNLWTQLCYFAAIVVVLMLLAGGLVGPTVVAPYVVVALFLRSYIYRFMAGVPHWTAAGAVLNRLDAEGYLFDKTTDSKVSSAAISRSTEPLSIDVKGVCYQYVGERDTTLFTAGPYDLTLDKPEIIFVTGPNGVGKSTFLKILCGLYPPESGQIHLNGKELSEASLADYRANFSALFTVPHVFPEVPIQVPVDAESRQRFEHYLQVLELDGKIELGKSSFVSELSHGQTKRLALLYALVDTRPVLIFDEWAENQDPAYKKIFYYQILPELRAAGRIVVAVTHESNYFDAADRIYTLSASE